MEPKHIGDSGGFSLRQQMIRETSEYLTEQLQPSRAQAGAKPATDGDTAVEVAKSKWLNSPYLVMSASKLVDLMLAWIGSD